MGLFTSTAHAASTAGNAAANGAAGQPNQLFSSGLMILAFIVVFYLLIWRPQSRRMKEQKNLMNSLNIGDEVTTNGGIVGKITKMEDSFIHLSIAQGVTIKLRKDAIANVLPKGSLKADKAPNNSKDKVKSKS